MKTEKIVYKTIGPVNLKLWVHKSDERSAAAGRPAVLWIHGGGWNSGSPAYFSALPGGGADVYRYFCAQGAVCIGVEYRLLQTGSGQRNPDGISSCVRDCLDAVAFVRRNARLLGVDQRKITVCGDSAGGHLALCTATVALCAGENYSAAAAAVACNGITDLTQRWARQVMPLDLCEANLETQFLERHSLLAALSPSWRICAGGPPVMMLHGLQDTIVHPAESLCFARQYREAGNRAEVRLYPDAKHAFILPAFTNHIESLIRALNDIDIFLLENELL